MHTVLEIGVYHGFSSMIWAHAVGAKGQVTGLEFDPVYAKVASSVFVEHGMGNIRVVTGDALATLSQQVPSPVADGIEGEPYDIIFIDAQKSGYPDYLRTILEHSPPCSAGEGKGEGEGESKNNRRRLLRKGGLIIGDNALRWGSVIDDSEEKNPVAYHYSQKYERGEWESELDKLREFNREMKENPRLETWLCPLWDGLAMARLKD